MFITRKEKQLRLEVSFMLPNILVAEGSYRPVGGAHVSPSTTKNKPDVTYVRQAITMLVCAVRAANISSTVNSQNARNYGFS